jgi:hypothetical protein
MHASFGLLPEPVLEVHLFLFKAYQKSRVVLKLGEGIGQRGSPFELSFPEEQTLDYNKYLRGSLLLIQMDRNPGVCLKLAVVLF